MTYTLQTSSCGAPDNGQQVASNTSGNCWILGNQMTYSVTQWGASGSGTSVTGTIAQGSNSLTVSGLGDFFATQPIDVYGAGATENVGVPTSVSMTTGGTTGAQTYHVQIVSIDANLGYSAASVSIAGDGSGNALQQVTQAGSVAQYQLISWSAPAGTTPISYAVYDDIPDGPNMLPPGTMVCRAVTVNTAWRDYGQVTNPLTGIISSSCPPWLPTNPPTVAGNDVLRTTISAIPDNSHFTLANTAGNAVTGGAVKHDDYGPMQAALNAQQAVYIPCGTFHITQGLALNVKSSQQLNGQGKQCSVITPEGGFDVVSILGTGGGTTTFADYLTNFEISALGMVSGFCTTVNNSNRPQISQIFVQNCYNEQQYTNVFIGSIDHYFSIGQRRGDVGVARP